MATRSRSFTASRRLAPIPVQRQALNFADTPLNRAGELMRLKRGPARVKRIGHGVMGSPDLLGTVGWFRDTLGLVCSDDVYAGSKDHIIGSFNRCDRGEQFVDHQCLLLHPAREEGAQPPVLRGPGR